MQKIEILYEDKDIVAVNKPAGLVVHPDGKTVEPALTDWVLAKYPDAKDVGEPISLSRGGVISRPGIVHRLDRETSGVLLVAKTKEGHTYLKELFKTKGLSKRYYAFVHGAIDDRYGVINKPIGRSSKDFRQWTSGPTVRGEVRPAETWYTVVAKKGAYSLVEAEPRTGRTHQIRVHFKAINHPVVGDNLYAPGLGYGLGFKRTALHAHSIVFTNIEGKKISIVSPFPPDFEEAAIEMGINLPKT